MIATTPLKIWSEFDLPASYRRCKKVWDAVTEELMVELLVNKEEVKLPGMMGTMGIRGKKTPIFPDGAHRIRNINWPETLKLWDEYPECKENKQFVLYLNEHSDMVYYKYYWGKKKMKVSNRHLYRFVPTSTNKKRLAKLIMSGEEYQNNIDEWKRR